MKFVFTGEYTNGRTSMTILGHEFVGSDPTEVVGEGNIAKLKSHTEFAIYLEPEKVERPKLKIKQADD